MRACDLWMICGNIRRSISNHGQDASTVQMNLVVSTFEMLVNMVGNMLTVGNYDFPYLQI
jgi:hypothetical protein